MSEKSELKKCCQCGETKPVTEFGVNRSRNGGLQSWCKECSNKYSGLRHLYPEGVKVCRQCREMKPKSCFEDSPTHKDGKKTICKDCESKNRGAFEAKNENEMIVPMTEKQIMLLQCSDDELIDELKRRGYTGEIGILKVVTL